MPFSRYQIRNEFSLADPELYKAADKDDPEALLEGVAMAGLVGVLRQLGDLAEFAAEIFHGLHEEVMVTATRGHGLLVRVQQLESDFPSIERAFLSQTGHSAFFTSSGIGWHPNLQTEQNLITKGDLPRFVMDSYEECRGPPRLFLLDKFDVAGAGACLKRYTDPSFYKVEASSFEMRNTGAHRDKNVRKTKKKASRWKNGETPDVFQPSHIKLHQLLLEERMQNATSQPARHVKLKKREIKFPFDTETGKGYMETLLTSPIEEKRVHEVSMVNLPTQNGSIDMEHIDNTPEDLPEPLPENLPEVYSEIEEEVEEKLISIDQNHKSDNVVSDGDETDDVASEGENYVDALGTMESEIETETETRGNSDPSTEQQVQSHFSDSHDLSEEEKIASFTSSDISSNDNSPRGVNSTQAFASTEIPFRPRVSPNVSMDGGVVLEESGSKLESSNCVDVDSSERIEESEIVPESMKGSIVDDQSLLNHESEVDNEDGNSNSALEFFQVEGEIVDPSMEEVGVCDEDVKNHSEEITDGSDSLVKWESTNDFLESKSDVVLSSSEDETEMELNERKAELFELESEAVKAYDEDDGITEDNLDIVEEEKELMEREPEPESESVVSVADVIDSNENKDLSICEDKELEGTKDESIENVEKDEEDDDDVAVLDSNESVGKKESLISLESDSIPSLELTESGEKKEPDVSTELDSVPSASYEDSTLQFLDTIPTNENNVENPSEILDENLFLNEKTDEKGDVQPDLDLQTDNSIPSIQPNAQSLEDSNSPNSHVSTEVQTNSHIDIVTEVPDQEIESKSMNNESYVLEQSKESQHPIESTPSIVPVFEEPSMVDLPQLSNQSQMNLPEEVNYPLAPMFPSITILPQLSPPINLEEIPPLPPLPPMQWRMGKLPNTCSIPSPNDTQLFPQIVSEPPIIDHNQNLDTQHNTNHFPPSFPQTVSQPPPIDQFENADENKSERDDDYEENESSSQVLETESNSRIEENGKELKLTKEQIAQQPPFDVIKLQSEIVSTSGDDVRPNGIRPMKVQRPRTPLIDAVAAHDKSKLRKVSERARPPVPVQEEEERDTLLPLRKVSERARPQIPKEEERDTLLEQIRAKSFNLKPAVQTRPSIQGPSTNLRVAAILEKANAIRQAFAGSDDDEDDDSWSDS